MPKESQYTDLDFKLRKLSSGDVYDVKDDKAINQSLTSLFLTRKGERLFNLEYGSRIQYMLFEPFDNNTARAIVDDIKHSVLTWERDRINLDNVSINMDYDTMTYNISIDYTIKSTTDTGTLNLNLGKV